jgi:hypothetical protein
MPLSACKAVNACLVCQKPSSKNSATICYSMNRSIGVRIIRYGLLAPIAPLLHTHRLNRKMRLLFRVLTKRMYIASQPSWKTDSFSLERLLIINIIMWLTAWFSPAAVACGITCMSIILGCPRLMYVLAASQMMERGLPIRVQHAVQDIMRVKSKE